MAAATGVRRARSRAGGGATGDGYSAEELRRVHSQRFCELPKSSQSHVLAACLDLLNVPCRLADLSRKRFLGEPLLAACFSDTGAKLDQELLAGRLKLP